MKWIATEGGGLTRFDGTNWTTWNRANSKLPDNVVQALVFDRYQNLWIGMKDGGVAVFREGGVIPALRVESLLPDGEGHLVLRWTGGQGSYQVQSRASLSPGAWKDYGALTDQQSLTVDVDVSSRFFRVKETQP